MYQDYWIRTTDETTWLAQAQAAGVLVPSKDLNGQPMLIPAPGITVDVIGTIFTQGEYTMNADGTVTVTVAPVPISGWHVNLRSQSPLNTTELSVIEQPKNPARVWF